ncbi:MAG: membrane protein insertase YidC, partial [Sphingomicrobium sp.]
MTDSKNFFVAIALSALVLLGWSWAAERFFPTPKPAVSTAQTDSATGTAQTAPAPQAGQAQAPAAGPTVLRDRTAVLASTPRVAIQTPSLKGSINLKGAQFDDLVLLTQRIGTAKKSPPVRLFSPLGTKGAYVATFGWAGQTAPGLDTLWTADSRLLAPGRPVILTSQSADGLRYQLKISVDDGYLFSVDQSVANASGRPVALRPIGLIRRGDKSADSSTWTEHVGPMSVLDGKADYEIEWETLDDSGPNGIAADNVTGWLGFTDKYWLAALAPVGDPRMTTDFRRSPNGGYQADYALAPAIVEPGKILTSKTRLFAGAKEKKWLDRYEDQGIVKLSKAIDWGWFEWFMRPIFALLLVLFRLTGNFGVAIIGLTLIVRLIMFPIAQRQFQS